MSGSSLPVSTKPPRICLAEFDSGLRDIDMKCYVLSSCASRESSVHGYNCQWRSGLGRGRRRHCHHLPNVSSAWFNAVRRSLVIASSLSPMYMADSYWCFCMASRLQSFSNCCISTVTSSQPRGTHPAACVKSIFTKRLARLARNTLYCPSPQL